jgi:O-antigen/teichoic acid export membrane protein
MPPVSLLETINVSLIPYISQTYVINKITYFKNIGLSFDTYCIVTKRETYPIINQTTASQQ